MPTEKVGIDSGTGQVIYSQGGLAPPSPPEFLPVSSRGLLIPNNRDVEIDLFLTKEESITIDNTLHEEEPAEFGDHTTLIDHITGHTRVIRLSGELLHATHAEPTGTKVSTYTDYEGKKHNIGQGLPMEKVDLLEDAAVDTSTTFNYISSTFPREIPDVLIKNFQWQAVRGSKNSIAFSLELHQQTWWDESRRHDIQSLKYPQEGGAKGFAPLAGLLGAANQLGNLAGGILEAGQTLSDLAQQYITPEMAAQAGAWLGAALGGPVGAYIGQQLGDLAFGGSLDLSEIASDALNMIPGIGPALSSLAQDGMLDGAAQILSGQGGLGALFNSQDPLLQGGLNAIGSLMQGDIGGALASASQIASGLGLGEPAAMLQKIVEGDTSGAIQQGLEMAGQDWAANILQQGASAPSLAEQLISASANALGKDSATASQPTSLLNQFGQPVIEALGSMIFNKGSIPWQTWYAKLGNAGKTYKAELWWNYLGFPVFSLYTPEGLPIISEREIVYGEDLLSTVQWLNDLRGWFILPLGLSDPATPTEITEENLGVAVHLMVFHIDEKALWRGMQYGPLPAWAEES